VADLTPNLENYMIASFSDSNTHGNVQKVTAAGEEGSLSGFALDQLQRQAQFGFYDLLADMPISQVRTRQWQIINTTTWQASDNLKIKNIISYAEYRQTLRQPEFGTNFQVNNANGFNNLVSFLNNTYNRSGNPGLDPLNLPNNAALLATLHGLADTPGLGFNYAQINPRPGGYDTAAEATFTEELQFQGTGFDDRLNWQGGFYFERATPLGDSGVQTTVESQCQNINSTSPGCFSPLAVAASAYYQALLANGVPVSTAARLGILPVGGYNPSVFSNTLQDTALYLQATYKLTDRLSLTGGFRYTWDKVSNADDPRFVGFAIDPLTGALSSQTYCAASALPAPAEGCFKANSSKSSAPTWLIDVDWKPINNVLVYAKWARGYRAGGLKPDVVAAVTALVDYAQNPLPTIGTTYEVDSWKPEKVDAFEVGLKSSFHGVVSGTFNVAGFYNKFSNQQVLLGLSSLTAPVPGQSSIYNAGRSRIYGVEVDTSLNLFRGFELNVGYTYLNTKAQEVSVLPGIYATPSGALTIVNPSAVVGLPLSYSPKNKVVVNGNYTLPLDEHIGEVTFGATFTHTDRQYGTYNDVGVPSLTVNKAGQTVLSTDDLGLLQATNILDLNFSWRKVLGSQFDLSAFATNVTGVKYYTGVPGLLGLGVEVSSIGAPRIWGARLKVHF
jgi:iron complex outermembrane receptor protein